MSELLIATVFFSTLCLLVSAWLYRKIKMTAKAMGSLMIALTKILDALTEQGKVNEMQARVNNEIGTSLEMLGVHTKLIKPSIGFEAERFLNFYNKRKEEE
jgi:hypothetical protein